MEFRQYHEPAGFTLEKGPHPLDRSLCEIQTQFGRFELEKDVLQLPAFEPITIQRV
jgi:hypothetical protein